MAHHHHGDAKKSAYSKVQKIVGHTDRYTHHSEKARSMADHAYYQNEHLDPLTLPATEQIGPIPAGKPAGSAVKRK